MQHVYQSFIEGLLQTSLLEFIAVVAGIACVWLGKAENILNYPLGILNTGTYIYLSLRGNLLGEASVNVFYTVMNIYGWVLWARKGMDRRPSLVITRSSGRDWAIALAFFAGCWLALYVALTYAKTSFAPRAIPLADGFSAAAAYTGMWLLTRKKIENWIWWIITDIASIPLYFIKGYVFTSFQFLVFLVIAILGLMEWIRKWKGSNPEYA